MKIIRVFPRKTAATPDDENVRIATPPGFFDEADAVHVSVAFEWDKPFAEELAFQWERIAPVSIGGPAYGDPGNGFIPGMYIKKGYVITSRGCPNMCWFCRAWRNEGRTIRELPIKDGYNVLDNNLLACSIKHQQSVFEMLLRQPQRPRFTGGFESANFTEWHAEWLVRLKPTTCYFAYDTPDDYEPLVAASSILSKAGLLHNHAMRCYVLIGWRGDTIENAETRLNKTINLGFMPMAMLYDYGNHQPNNTEWKQFQRIWARPTIIGCKMRG